jgi:hypothetical protein
MKNPLVKPQQNPFETVMHISPFISSEPTLFEGVEPSTPKEDDSEVLCEDEQPSSPSIELKPLSIVLASAFHEDFLEMENSWAMELCEEPTLEPKEKDSLDKHGNFILEPPQEPCLHNAFLESATRCKHTRGLQPP